MRVIPVALAGCVLLSPAALGGPREEALAVVQRWSDAFAASDLARLIHDGNNVASKAVQVQGFTARRRIVAAVLRL